MMRLIWLIKWRQDGRGFPCLFHFLTGFYCPGCGGTRAVRLLLQGDLAGSLLYHPFVLYMVLVFFAEVCFFGAGWFGAHREQNLYVRQFQQRYPRWVLIGAGIVGGNWVIKNLFLLAGIDLLLPL